MGNPYRHFFLLGSAVVLTGLAVLLDKKPELAVYAGNLRNPFAGSRNPLDRMAWKSPDPAAANLADAGLYGGPSLPLFLALHPRARPYFCVLLLTWLETVALTFAATSVIKNSFNRPRPYVLATGFDPERELLRNDRAAFLSGHTALAAAGSMLFARLVELYEPEWRTKAWFLAGSVSGFTAYLRVKAAKHWPTDAVAGVLLGAGISALVFEANQEALTSERENPQLATDCLPAVGL